MGNISTAMRKSTNGGHETVTCWLTLSFLQRQRGGRTEGGAERHHPWTTVWAHMELAILLKIPSRIYKLSTSRKI